MSNLPEIIPVHDDKIGMVFIVVVTPEFNNAAGRTWPLTDSDQWDDTGAWWQLVKPLNGEVVAYGFAKGIGGCMLRAKAAGRKAARYRINKWKVRENDHAEGNQSNHQ